MPRIVSEQTLLRIFIGEQDRCGHRPLYEALVEELRAGGFSGATVLKGAMGFGSHSVTHSDRYLRLSGDLPVVIEVVESEEKIASFLPRLDELMSGGLVTLEKVRAIRYSPSPCRAV